MTLINDTPTERVYARSANNDGASGKHTGVARFEPMLVRAALRLDKLTRSTALSKEGGIAATSVFVSSCTHFLGLATSTKTQCGEDKTCLGKKFLRCRAR